MARRPARTRDRAGARRRPASARVRSRADGAALCAPRRPAYSQAHVRIDAVAARRRRSSSASWSGLGFEGISSSATFTPTSRRLTPCWTRPARTTMRSCSAISSATARTRTPSSIASGRSPAATFIRGNHDKVGAGLENTDGFNYLARHAISWTANTLTPDHRQWLAALAQGPVVDR